MFHLHEGTYRSQIHKDEKQNGGCWGLGEGENRENGQLIFNGHRISVSQNEKSSGDGGDGYTIKCT